MALAPGTMLVDEDGDEWLVRSCTAVWVTVQHPRRGVHRLRRSDLEAWIDTNRWSITSVP